MGGRRRGRGTGRRRERDRTRRGWRGKELAIRATAAATHRRGSGTALGPSGVEVEGEGRRGERRSRRRARRKRQGGRRSGVREGRGAGMRKVEGGRGGVMNMQGRPIKSFNQISPTKPQNARSVQTRPDIPPVRDRTDGRASSGARHQHTGPNKHREPRRQSKRSTRKRRGRADAANASACRKAARREASARPSPKSQGNAQGGVEGTQGLTDPSCRPTPMQRKRHPARLAAAAGSEAC